MTETYEIRLGESLKTAWGIFCKAPEVFVAYAFAIFAVIFVLGPIPFVGQWILLLLSAFTPAAFFLAAQEGSRQEKITFQSLQPLTSLAPQLLMLFVVKAILVGLGTLCLILPGIYLMVVFVYAELFVVLEGRTFLEALRASKELASRNFWGHLGLCLALGMLVCSGALLVGIGLMLTLPLSLLTLFVVFRRLHIRVVG